jgi:hypothetical protein
VYPTEFLKRCLGRRIDAEARYGLPHRPVISEVQTVPNTTLAL